MSVLTSVLGHDPARSAPVTVVQRRRGWARLDLRELPAYRDLLWLLALRDIQVRYKQTVLGALWAILQPVVSMLVLSAVFGRLLGVTHRIGHVPYPVFLYAGLLPWMLFAASVTATSGSLVGNANLLGKVYFPRLIVPLSALGAPLVDYAVASLVLVGLMWWYQTPVTAGLLLLPPLVATLLLTALAVGLTLAALTVTYRDVRHVVPFLLQTWFFLTPVIIPESLLPERWRWVMEANPMAGTIAAFRAAVLGQSVPYGWWGACAAVSAVALWGSLRYFRRTERRFADVL